MAAELNESDELREPLAGALKALDERATRRAAAVDAARVAAHVLQRLREEPVIVMRPRPWNLTALRVAAAVAVLVIGGAVAQRLLVGPRGSGMAMGLPVVTSAEGLVVDSTDATQETALLAAVDDARAAAHGALPATTVLVEDLTEQELQTLLSTMENRDGAL
jgi:hypothetical protein